MGLYVPSADSNAKYRHYTANFEEFKQFKKNGSPEISATHSEAQSRQEAPDKLSFLKLEELYNLANPLGTLDSLKRILANKNSNIQLELERYCRDESKKWEDVAAMAKNLIRAGSKDSKYGFWLKQVVLCSEMCVPERVDIFMEQLKILDKNWLDIKIKHLISEKD